MAKNWEKSPNEKLIKFSYYGAISSDNVSHFVAIRNEIRRGVVFLNQQIQITRGTIEINISDS